MKEIKLTQGYTALVDDEDFEHLNQWKWHIQKNGSTIYAVRTLWTSKTQGTTIRMHRAIINPSQAMVVDHVDHNGLNNQKSNLRVCTKVQNGANRKKTKGTSKYLGVHFCSTRKVWVAQIQHSGKSYSAGLHQTEDSAAIAYNNKAIELHGEFANLNQLSQ